MKQMEEALNNLHKHLMFCKWRIESYDNGAERLTTFMDDKAVELIFDEMGGVFFYVECLLTHKVNKQELHYEDKETATKILAEVRERGIGDRNLYMELNRFLKSHSIINITGDGT